MAVKCLVRAIVVSLSFSVSAQSALYDDLKNSPNESFFQSSVPLDVFPGTDNRVWADERVKLLNVSTVDGGREYFPQTINVNEVLPYRYRELIGDSVYLQLLLLSSIGVLALMPESMTNWNAEELREKSLWVRWKENVFEGPVWDNDDWTINYIGHPVSGAFYYTMARNDGMSIAESAAFSTLMSTFFWEYGYEAFAEVPSVQDLIVTPLAGSILGEGMIVLQGKLDRNGGKLLGSQRLGNVAYFVLDPLGNIADWIRGVLKASGIDATVTMTVRTYPMAEGMPSMPFKTSAEYSMLYGEREYGIVLTIY